MTLIDIPLAMLHDDPRNPNVCSAETLDKLKANIQRTGLCPPLIVRPKPKTKNHYILIDGHHRKQVLQALGWQTVTCQVWEVDDKDARLALATLNRLRGTDVVHKRAELIASLTETMAIDELAGLIPENDGEIADMLAWLRMDGEGMTTSLTEAITEEEALLPVAYSFLVNKGDVGVVDEALTRLAQPPDRGATLVYVCQLALRHVDNNSDVNPMSDTQDVGPSYG